VEKLPPFDEILVNICGYELPTNLQNVTQKYLTEVKIFQKVFKGGGYCFLKHLVVFTLLQPSNEMFFFKGKIHVTATITDDK